MSDAKHPMQPVVLDDDGTPRFKANMIVRHLFTMGKLDLNELARMYFTPEDRMQLAQLLGYSIDGYGTLSYVTDESYAEADKAREELLSRPDKS